MKYRRKVPDKTQGIFIKMALVYAGVLFVVLAFVWLTINQFCLTFIKEQRIRYNTQLQEKAAYEMKDIYSKIDYLLVQLCNEDEFSKNKMKLSVPDESAFERIKREVDFAEDVKEVTYANGLGEYYSGILFFDGQDDSYSIGNGVIDSAFSFRDLREQYEVYQKAGSMVIIGPMEELYKGKYDPQKKVVGFMKKTNTGMKQLKGESNANAQYVMITFELDKIFKNTLLDDKGYFITNKSSNIIYESGMKEMDLEPADLVGKEGSVAAKKNLLVTSVPLEQYGWILSVVDEKDVLFQDVNSLFKRVGVFIVCGALLSILMFLLISRKILFPIALLKNMLHTVAKDNETYLDVITNDEVGGIANLINEMKARIKTLTEHQYLMEMKTTEAKLQVLQSQINPHFLYNTLDNIYCIAQIEEIEPISILTQNLSEMLRYSIDTKKMFVTLKDEMDYLEAYLHIINIRYEDRIELNISVEEDLWTCRVFKLLLQPLVENACIHGILPSQVEKGLIIITAVKKGEDVEIEVRNNGVVISVENIKRLNEKIIRKIKNVNTEKKKGFGIALENVNERLQLFYGNEYGMTVERIDGWGTCVRVRQKINS